MLHQQGVILLQEARLQEQVHQQGAAARQEALVPHQGVQADLAEEDPAVAVAPEEAEAAEEVKNTRSHV